MSDPALRADGFTIFPYDAQVAAWAHAAYDVSCAVLAKPAVKRAQLRHGNTWFVGVDTLPNTPEGAVGGVALSGAWQTMVPDLPLHRAQISVIYPGYPQQDPGESNANHRYRSQRLAAHVDGLLPLGHARRRYPKELHAYILGLPLNAVEAAPTVVWKGSHVIMKQALGEAIGGADPGSVDVTEAYQAARRVVFERCEKIALRAAPGQAFLLDRFALHGTAAWDPKHPPVAQGRMVAFFRPQVRVTSQWLGAVPTLD